MDEPNSGPAEQPAEQEKATAQEEKIAHSKDGTSGHEILEAFFGGVVLAIGGLVQSDLPKTGLIIGAVGVLGIIHGFKRKFAAVIGRSRWANVGTLVLVLGVLAVTAWMFLGKYQKERLETDLLIPANEETPALRIAKKWDGRLSVNLSGGRIRVEQFEHFEEPTPKEINLKIDHGEMVLLLGDITVSTLSTVVVLKLYGKDVLTINKRPGGISVAADIRDDEGKVLATIENNKFRLNPNRTMPLIRPDPHTLIVEDERGTCVLSVRFLNPSTIKVKGHFRAGGEYPVIIDEHQIVFGNYVLNEGVALHMEGPTIFEWPGQPAPNAWADVPAWPEGAHSFVRMMWQNGVASIIVLNTNGEHFSLCQMAAGGERKSVVNLSFSPRTNSIGPRPN